MGRIGLLMMTPLLAMAACAPQYVGERVGYSLNRASVDTGRAIADVGDRTGAALQRAGGGLRQSVGGPVDGPDPAYGAPVYGRPIGDPRAYPVPGYGSPVYAAPSYGTPGDAVPAYANPGYGAPGYDGEDPVPPRADGERDPRDIDPLGEPPPARPARPPRASAVRRDTPGLYPPDVDPRYAPGSPSATSPSRNGEY